MKNYEASIQNTTHKSVITNKRLFLPSIWRVGTTAELDKGSGVELPSSSRVSQALGWDSSPSVEKGIEAWIMMKQVSIFCKKWHWGMKNYEASIQNTTHESVITNKRLFLPSVWRVGTTAELDKGSGVELPSLSRVSQVLGWYSSPSVGKGIEAWKMMKQVFRKIVLSL